MKITCPSCGREIPPDQINIQTGIGRCTDCSEAFSFMDQVGATQVASAAAAPGRGAPLKTDVSMPKGFSVSQQLADLVITRRWFTPAAFGLLFFCLFWDGFLVVWYTIGLTQHGPLIMFLFPLIHVAVGVGITYAMLGTFINATDFRVNDRQLTIRHYPLPWAGCRNITVENIDQLYCAQQYGNTRNGTTITYNLCVQQKSGQSVTLVTGLPDPASVRYLEQEIEKRLGIADRLVPGEMYT